LCRRRSPPFPPIGTFLGIPGSLEPGKLADLVMWHDNPDTVATEDILKLTVDLRMVGGKVVHQA
jgi:predicted amidohydrolase YtcJ